MNTDEPVLHEISIMTRNVSSGALTLLLCACGGIWNGADLQAWVEQRAIEQGCIAETILLDEWYTKESDQNVWHGQCVGKTSGDQMRLAIPVDSVWSSSEEQ